MKIYPIVDLIGTPLLGAAGLALLAAERIRPLRERLADRRARRLVMNGALALAAFGITRFAVVPTMVWASRRAARSRFGLVRILPLPGAMRVVVAILALDYAMYVWHRMNHGVPSLWRFHRVHHTDLDLDVLTAFRFHFGELTASVAFRAIQVALTGAGARTALAYEVLMQCATAFHHSNVRLPRGLEHALNQIFVTPRMHTIHHSIKEEEVSSNWSVIFSFWDRLHGTFKQPSLKPREPHIEIGVPEQRDPRELTLFHLLAMPFRAQRNTQDAE
jgi:sterol desaturase/sphingolipid hydroxylase (fatty acid hydroxylase superfamily)